MPFSAIAERASPMLVADGPALDADIAICFRTLRTSSGLKMVSAMVHPQLAANHSRCHVLPNAYTPLGGADAAAVLDDGDIARQSSASPSYPVFTF